MRRIENAPQRHEILGDEPAVIVETSEQEIPLARFPLSEREPQPRGAVAAQRTEIRFVRRRFVEAVGGECLR